MQRTTKIQGRLALVCALTWGAAVPAFSQDAMPAPTAQTPVAQENPIPPAPVLPESVPTYEPTAYELTPGGPGAENRSETLRWPNRPLLVTSTLVLAASYVPAVLIAALRDEDTTNNLYIPVAGPWLELSQESATNGNKALLVVDGVFQGLGALGMITSLLVPERRTSQWYLIGNRRLAVVPIASPVAYGVSASGRF